MRYCLLIILMLSCRQPELPLTTQQNADLRMPELYDPYKLPRVLGAEGAYLAPKYEGAKSTVPHVAINLLGDKTDGYSVQADSYEIQRCPAGADLVTAAGTDPLKYNYPQHTDKIRQADYLYVWGMAAAGACTLLGGKHIAAPFVDDFNTEKLSTDFNFFYIVRPCLRADRSIYRSRRMCGYAYARTELIKGYVNEAAVQDSTLRAKLAAQRDRLEYRMMQIASVIRQKATYLQRCEFNESRKHAMRRRLAGINKVAVTATAAVVAAIFSGGTAAFLAASAAAQLGDKLFSGISNATLNCPTEEYDTSYKKIYADAKEIITSIGTIREELNEISLANTAPTPVDEAITELAGDDCAEVGLGANCQG